MHSLVRHLFSILLHLGGFGLVILGVLDSSFLILPFGNDLLLIALSARRHELVMERRHDHQDAVVLDHRQ